MKLKECYVSSFGKLKDFKYAFNDSLNVINAENGFGKTTLSIFIKSMFYGLNDSKRDVDNNERKKYKPWNSLEKFGGYLIFEKDNTLFKIERFFGNKEAEDTCILTDLTTGKTYENHFQLGNKLFEIDEEGFNSTTFFSQKDFSVKSNTSLTAKFNEVCEVQDSLSFDKALLKVNNRLKEYKYTGDRGLIPDTKRKINEIEIEINRTAQTSQYLVGLREQKTTLEKTIDELKDEVKQLSEKISLSIKRQAFKDNEKVYNKISAENQDILNRLNSLKLLLNNKNLDNDEVLVCQDSIAQINALINKRDIINQDIEHLMSQKNSLPKNKGVNLTVLLCAICLIAIVGVILFVTHIVSLPLFIGIIALSAVLILLWLYLLKKGKKDNSSVFNSLLENKISEQNEIAECIEKYNVSLEIFFSRFNLQSHDYYSKLDELKGIISSIKECEKNIAFNNQTLKNLNFEPIDDYQESVEDDSKLLTRLQEQKNIELQELIKKHTSILSLIKQKEQEESNSIFLENKLEELNALLKTQQEEMEVLKITSNYLQRADECLKIKYKMPIQKALDKYLDMVTEGEINAQMDINFNLTINNQALSVQPEYFSKGFRNLFDICKRFALIEVLFSKEKPFVILDDPFSNLDQEKLSKSLEVIKKLSNDYQIIYFTCHNSRSVGA